MKHIVNAVQAQLPGIGIQLAHDTRETSWEAHGSVKLLDAEGSLIYEQPDYQHNRKFSEQQSSALGIAETVAAFLEAKTEFANQAAKARGESDDTVATKESDSDEEEKEGGDGDGDGEAELAGLTLEPK